jgi:hypothetical protein
MPTRLPGAPDSILSESQDSSSRPSRGLIHSPRRVFSRCCRRSLAPILVPSAARTQRETAIAPSTDNLVPCRKRSSERAIGMSKGTVISRAARDANLLIRCHTPRGVVSRRHWQLRPRLRRKDFLGQTSPMPFFARLDATQCTLRTAPSHTMGGTPRPRARHTPAEGDFIASISSFIPVETNFSTRTFGVKVSKTVSRLWRTDRLVLLGEGEYAPLSHVWSQEPRRETTWDGICTSKMWRGAESNCRHRDFQSRALPTELPRLHGRG